LLVHGVTMDDRGMADEGQLRCRGQVWGAGIMDIFYTIYVKLMLLHTVMEAKTTQIINKLSVACNAVP